MDFLLGEVKRGLVVCPSCVHDHAMQGPSLLDDLVDGGSDGGLLCDIGLEGLKTAWVLGLCGRELLARLGVVDGVDELSVIVQTGLSHAEADATVGSSDCGC